MHFLHARGKFQAGISLVQTKGLQDVKKLKKLLLNHFINEDTTMVNHSRSGDPIDFLI